LLQELLKDPGAVAERGRLGRERIQERFNWDRVTDEVERFYLELL
jgi:glycosyltransferase involved in cell wall biosynthesis